MGASTLATLARLPWPGNVRELENAVQRAIALAGEREELALSDLVPLDPRWRGATEVSTAVRPLRDVLRETERAHIQRALEACGGHRSQTAELLGISQPDVSRLLRGNFRDYSVERLLRLLTGLGRDVEIVIRRPRARRQGRVSIQAA